MVSWTHRSLTAAPRHDRRLRVLQVINSLNIGGAEQLLVTLARHIDRGGYDLRVCSLAPLRDSPIVHELRLLGVPLYSVGAIYTREPRPVIRLATLVRRYGIDVLHTHLGSANTLGPLAGALAHRPVVSTLHTLQHNAQPAAPGLGMVKQAAQSQILRWGAHTIIACAPEVRVAALERLHLPARKLVDVPNGIDTQAFAPVLPAVARARRRELLGAGDGPLVLTVGNLRQAKGHEYLVAATREVMEHVPGVTVAIVGQGGTYEPVVRAQIEALGLQDRVILTGQRRDIRELLAAADLFVLPSVLEGLPLALLEAQAAGTPVVATAVGGVPRVVEDGVTGRLVAAGDAAGLARVMVDLLQRPAEARQLAAAGCERVRTAYGADAWARRLESIYSTAAFGTWATGAPHLVRPG